MKLGIKTCVLNIETFCIWKVRFGRKKRNFGDILKWKVIIEIIKNKGMYISNLSYFFNQFSWKSAKRVLTNHWCDTRKINFWSVMGYAFRAQDIYYMFWYMITSYFDFIFSSYKKSFELIDWPSFLLYA